VGKGEWSTEGRPLPKALAAAMAAQEAEGSTVVTVAEGERWLGAVALADELRPGARAAMDGLRRAGVEHIALLSGDSRPVAEHIGKLVGADIVEARLTPEDKVRAIRRLRDKYHSVGMVGDGVNDAPALAMATVGIAMGSRGTDAALETADIVLMKDDLARLATAVQLGRATRNIITQNLTLAVLVIVTLVGTTLGIGLPLAWGVVGHEGSTLLVVLNSLRLLGFKARR
jgi:Cd2+/Zn2+-exporting ATPase